MGVYLAQQQKELIRNLLARHGLKGCVFAFGSRARGDYGKYSDLDLLIRGILISPEIVNAIKEELSDSDLPITVDLVLFDQLPEELKISVGKELIPFF